MLGHVVVIELTHDLVESVHLDDGIADDSLVLRFRLLEEGLELSLNASNLSLVLLVAEEVCVSSKLGLLSNSCTSAVNRCGSNSRLTHWGGVANLSYVGLRCNASKFLSIKVAHRDILIASLLESGNASEFLGIKVAL